MFLIFKLIPLMHSKELMRTLVVDGNFTADHLRQKRAMDDVWLAEGTAMMTSRQPYHKHLVIAKDTHEVSDEPLTDQLFTL